MDIILEQTLNPYYPDKEEQKKSPAYWKDLRWNFRLTKGNLLAIKTTDKSMRFPYENLRMACSFEHLDSGTKMILEQSIDFRHLLFVGMFMLAFCAISSWNGEIFHHAGVFFTIYGIILLMALFEGIVVPIWHVNRNTRLINYLCTLLDLKTVNENDNA